MVHVPALRERRGDIGPIARELLRQLGQELGRRELSSSALAHLVSHEWRGNVRELRNVLYRAADLAHGQRWIDSDHVEQAMHTHDDPKQLTLTPQFAKALFAQHGNNMSAAARAAGCPRTTFRKILNS